MSKAITIKFKSDRRSQASVTHLFDALLGRDPSPTCEKCGGILTDNGPSAGRCNCPFRQGEKCIIAELSQTVPLACQGGGQPKVGDVVTVGTYPDAVRQAAHIPGGMLYWCIGQNDTGEYGASFVHQDLRAHTENP